MTSSKKQQWRVLIKAGICVRPSTQNWETPKPGETVVSSRWGAQSGNVRIFRLEKIIQNNSKWKRNIIFPALQKPFVLSTITHVRGKQAFQHLIESMYYSFVCTARVWGWPGTRQVKALTYFLPLPSATRGTGMKKNSL